VPWIKGRQLFEVQLADGSRFQATAGTGLVRLRHAERQWLPVDLSSPGSAFWICSLTTYVVSIHATRG